MLPTCAHPPSDPVSEMLAAQGFPGGYQAPRVKRRAVRMIGNSVSLVPSSALAPAAA